MTDIERLQKIRKYFKDLKSARNWCQLYFPTTIGQTEEISPLDKNMVFLNDKLLPAVEKVYIELEKLGVDKTFSAALFIFGPPLTTNLVYQFK